MQNYQHELLRGRSRIPSGTAKTAISQPWNYDIPGRRTRSVRSERQHKRDPEWQVAAARSAKSVELARANAKSQREGSASDKTQASRWLPAKRNETVHLG